MQTFPLASIVADISEGAALYDGEGRLAFANAALPGILGLASESIAIGVTLGAFVSGNVGRLCRPGGEDELLRSYGSVEMPESSRNFRLDLPGGRRVEVARTRLPGGGFVDIHHDCGAGTDRRAAHDLNQPLNVIRLSADNARHRLAAGRADDTYLTAKLTRIIEQTDRAVTIVEKMRTGKPSPNAAAEDVELREMTAPRAR